MMGGILERKIENRFPVSKHVKIADGAAILCPDDHIHCASRGSRFATSSKCRRYSRAKVTRVIKRHRTFFPQPELNPFIPR